MLTLLLLVQAAAGPAATPPPADDRCVALMKQPAEAAGATALQWERSGGGAIARQCLGLNFANRGDWAGAAAAFEGAGRLAQGDDPRVATYWAQAGNAWLAAGQAGKAIPALERALASKDLVGFDRGEVELDRGRALALTGDRAGARMAIDRALTDADEDPLAWLLSATLARQMGDLSRARTDIGQAVTRAADDPSVQLEAGNIAALAGDEAAAKAAWSLVVKLRPDSAQAKAATTALAQFGGGA